MEARLSKQEVKQKAKDSRLDTEAEEWKEMVKIVRNLVRLRADFLEEMQNVRMDLFKEMQVARIEQTEEWAKDRAILTDFDLLL